MWNPVFLTGSFFGEGMEKCLKHEYLQSQLKYTAVQQTQLKKLQVKILVKILTGILMWIMMELKALPEMNPVH
ncbi:hypothetical protein CVD23_14060 [Bacillus sp. V33-4]|nr:hypothetical protein CVD23_14060 [Bacillus sp. V33-4]